MHERMVQSFHIQVEAYAGHKAEERPKAFLWKGRRIEVKKILDRWYGENADYFKVMGDDDVMYILSYKRHDDAWYVTMATDARLTRVPS